MVAMVTIVFFHAGVSGAGNAFIALDLFFVLSGFLVTHVVLTEVDETGTLNLRRFYARRVRRLLPAAVLAVLGTTLLVLLTFTEPERAEFIRHAQAALVYLANWQFVAEAHDYFGTEMTASPFMHYWSLSLEEQYYIIFPLLVMMVLAAARGRQRVLLAVLGCLFVASVASQLVSANVDPVRAYYATDARLFQLLAGALVAIGVRELTRVQLTARAGAWLTALGFGGYLLLGSELFSMSASARNLLATPLACAMVLGLYTTPSTSVGRLLSAPTSVYLGKISYGTYLWHWPLILVLQRYTTTSAWVIATAALLLASAFAALSYQLVETPIRRARRLEGVDGKVVVAGLTVSVVTAAVVIAPMLASNRSPAVVLVADATEHVEGLAQIGDVADVVAEEVPVIDFGAVAKNRGPLGRCAPSAPEDCVLVDGDGPHLVLVGDSHARMLAPAFAALANERGFKLSISIAVACPWPHDLLRVGRVQERHEGPCREARDDFYTVTLPAMQPDLVLVANLARSDAGWDGHLARADGITGPADRMYSEAVQDTVDLVRSAGASMVMFHSIMGTQGWTNTGYDTLSCLAGASSLSECVVLPPSEPRPLADSIYEAAAIGDDRVASIDVNPLVCPTTVICSSVVDELAVWRDPIHVNPDIFVRHRAELWELIEESGVVDAG